MKPKVAQWTAWLTLSGLILTGLLVYRTLLAQEGRKEPGVGPGPLQVQEAREPAGEKMTERLFSTFLAPYLPSTFSETAQGSAPNYPAPMTPFPQSPMIPPQQLPVLPDLPSWPKPPKEEAPPAGPVAGRAGVELGPPSWVKPGVRITFYAASASIPGAVSQIVEDEHGNWIDPDTGQRYREADVAGAAGQGYVEVNVGYVDHQTAALDVRSYGKDIANGSITILSGAGGHLGPAHTGGEYWVHPQILYRIQERLTPGQKILRMPYHLNQRTYNALRIQTRTGNGFAYHTYDLDTGVLLSSGGSAQGGSVPVLGAGGAVGQGGGNTMIGLMRFQTMRQLNLPWNGGAMPDWIPRTRTLTYEGKKTVNVVAAGVYSFPCKARLTFQQFGPGWLKYTQWGGIYGPGMPSSEGQVERVVGTSQAGGLWIPSAALRQLRPGQTLDQDPYSQMRFWVQRVDGSGVHLIEEGSRASRSYVYNIKDGMLVSYSESKKLDMVTETTSLSLKGRE